jgi:hypothetical protein
MKKFIYFLLISVASSLAITSCTEDEEVTPTHENGGGGGVDPK